MASSPQRSFSDMTRHAIGVVRYPRHPGQAACGCAGLLSDQAVPTEDKKYRFPHHVLLLMKETMTMYSTRYGISGVSSTSSQVKRILFTCFFVRYVLLLIITASTSVSFAYPVGLIRTMKISIGQTSTTATIKSKVTKIALASDTAYYEKRSRCQLSIEFPRGFFDDLGGSHTSAKSAFIRNRAVLSPPTAHCVSLCAAASVPDNIPNVEISHPSSSTAKTKLRSLARKVTGLSLTSMRATGRAMTGFSLSALRLSLRSAMSQPITSILHWFVSLFPIWFRFFYQPFLMLYYWPLFIIQNLVGPSKDSKREALSTHEALVQSWREAIEAAEKANMGEMWPIHVTDSGQIRLSFPTRNDENSLLRGEFMEFLESDEDDIGANIGQAAGGGVEKEVIILDKPYTEAEEEIKVALVESVEEAIAESRPTNELQRIIPPWERTLSELHQIATIQPKSSSILSTKLTPASSTTVVKSQEKATEPVGPRWALAAKTCNLSGVWKLVESEEFKSQYDKYLLSLGQPAIVRTVALSLIGFTREEIIQEEEGRKLTINGINPRGVWNRLLISSGVEINKPSFQPIQREIYTADSEKVKAEAWWEGNGTIHKSWLRGGIKYGGGDFESSRYLASENVLICKSVFHPRDPKREKAQVTWRFQRDAAS